MTVLLTLDDVSRRFGGLVALDGVSLSLNLGEVIGLIGPNGAGKTTFVNVVTGVLKPTRGTIVFDGRRIDGLRPDRVARAGIARTFQIVQPFPRLSVRDNVAAAALFAGGIATPAEAARAADTHLAFCGLTREADKPAGSLTLAGRKRLELAKSLAAQPKLLMLDEVNAGLNSSEIDDALRLIQAIADRGITVLLIEHLMKVVARACSRLVVLHQGRLVADGPTEAVMRDEGVIEAYLGRRYAERQKGAGI
ncbi:ABC transporter ATP-binding protein [Bradyrhizobium sp. U87765 SZCCT0131]|uniref:ABC transporter ATP-binding protein n=1 Tax=unclassified Bradyrhizobium TaxID=2631580 RepID=UPI001BA4F2D6|nr:MULTISPECIES: ABC transporter ATP-binding protein [unclassified Bradyrhizobium]MBR1218896.1 ABC transporter ATP-binding protein [Bradyrhizobium sp. U87765 SZCCT0131]MBR1261547.1 ABC transporter ATP-binding protein [Bradyrhizobium sp. U87765 SZCCT0134]MBR1306600.1 ABC transporter ATP-binding protein [Bradyrhizobium sp. U87765 SZCCT0110]MBR1317329.1 ABC transporter ATP-binding protein [Bradyrhizobium sp. U87765 SZCCT0109]MBR1351031.1 ABC transporter ATP-binding protein [Bradyrhizobium sp. U87